MVVRMIWFIAVKAVS